MAGRTISPNLALDQLVQERIAAGESIVHLGFGESRLPVFGPLKERLAEGADRNAYGPVVGDPATRAAVAGYFARRRLPTDAEQVIVAPGSKPLLMALQLVAGGDTLVALPSWVTYAPQARLAGKTVLGVPIPASCGGVPDPAALRETIRAARVLGHDPKILVLTSPDNPTGTYAPDDLVRELCAIAEEEDLLIVSDEIYRDILHTPGTDLLSPAEVAPRRTVVITGLSKSLALGGWRIGAARFPAGPAGERLRADVASVASEIWSTLAGPMQAVAGYAFAEPPEVRERLAADAALHGAVAAAVHRIMVDAGATCRPPTGAFYVYPDFAPLRGPLAEQGVTDGASLQRHLLEELGVAVLSGHHFGDRPEALRFRAATSMLYGATPAEQRATQQAADPLAVPHVADALTRLEQALAKLPR
ncbi:pyridoxal phosphate-dependent aminotransferase [Micromonospora auratinigra]|uniref:Aminotransferase n=1 Tax=Micromonospora auratinigra TaxID=261654 RepID=A0A1A8ZIR9_9ACTN|nr:aminotransferase class I/II-fold pyridoxal phosphate-dependent enzyme [Micromonospora auratinigra]SBT43766.1 aspartate aminotransferase [Micromonospora auratinigra]